MFRVRLNDKPKVLMLSPALPPALGGIPRLAAFLQLSVRHRAQIQLVGVASPVRRRGGRTRTRLSRVAAIALYAVQAFFGAIAGGYDVIHALTWKAALPAAAVPRRRRPPLVLHCLGAELKRGGVLANRLRAHVMRNADALVAISEFTAGLARTTARGPVAVITPGLAELPSRRHASDPTKMPHVLSVGELVPPKGHDDLIRVVAQLHRRSTPARLTIVGAGPMRSDLSELVASLGLDEFVTLAGPVGDDELGRLYASADVFALLTKDWGPEFEGFGIVFLEAAAHGLPIVARASGGSREAITDDGAMLVSSPDDAVVALQHLIADPALRDRMSAANLRYAARFLPECLGPRLVEVYESVLRA